MTRVAPTRFCKGIILALAAIIPTIGFAYPKGQLYWATEQFPDHYFEYTQTAIDYNGALYVLDYACRQNSGSSGAYNGTIDIDASANNFPAQKCGWCINNTFIGPMDGAYYTASLYCNGELRQIYDTSPCTSTALVPENNFGPGCGN